MSDPKQTNHELHNVVNNYEDEDDIPDETYRRGSNDAGVAMNTTNEVVLTSGDDTNIHPVPPVLTSPDDRVIDGNHTLQSLDDTFPQSGVSADTTTNTTAVASTDEGINHAFPLPPVLALPDSQIIDGKNIQQSTSNRAPPIPSLGKENTHIPTPPLLSPDLTVQIDEKNALSSLEILTITRNVAVDTTSSPPPPMLPDGRVIDGKNTLQTFREPPRSTRAAVTASARPVSGGVVTDEAMEPTAVPSAIKLNKRRTDVVSDTSYLTIDTDNHVVSNGIDEGINTNAASVDTMEVNARRDANQYSRNDDVNNNHPVIVRDNDGDAILAEAMVVESFAVAEIVDSRRGTKFWIVIALLVVITIVTITGIGVVCGTGQCGSTSSSTGDQERSTINTNTPSTSPVAINPVMVACNFLSFTNITQCQKMTDFDGDIMGETIPSEVGLLTQLELLFLDGQGLSGTIPSTLGNLIQLTSLALSTNQLSGTIPSAMGNLILLSFLDLSDNQLNGTIPTILGSLSGIEFLDLSLNRLSGSIPSTLGNLDSLFKLYVAHNQLTGTIPSTLMYTNILSLKLAYNRLTGTVPSTFNKMGTSTLNELELYGNQLNGTIPATYGSMLELQRLFLGENQLTGPIPAIFGSLVQLTFLSLDNNRLNGTVPSSLGDLTRLNVLDLINNAQLAGTVPSSLCAVAGIDIYADCVNVSCSCCCCSLPDGGCMLQ